MDIAPRIHYEDCTCYECEQNKLIKYWKNEAAQLTTRNAELTEAIKALLKVEYITHAVYFTDSTLELCPWCEAEEYKHTPDCPRQKALALVESEE